ncbi:MAG TPA: VOC family protein [Solirubrobacterales bacterium]|nr:VOC family protein [Solirubrobacterales bacterium]
MAVERMDHVGIVVDDLATATRFFLELGLELEGEASVEGPEVDRINGLEDVQADVAMLQTPDGRRLELAKYRSPSGPDGDPQAPANTPGIRHLCFAVDDIEATLARLQGLGAELVGELVNYKDSYWLCYLRGPEGIIVELAQKI